MFNRPPKGVSLRLARGQESRGHYSRAQWRLKGAPRCSTLPRRDEQSRLIFPFSYEGVDDVPDEEDVEEGAADARAGQKRSPPARRSGARPKRARSRVEAPLEWDWLSSSDDEE